MRISVFPAKDEDIPQLFTVCSRALGEQIRDPAWCALYPSHSTPAGRLAGAERYLKSKQSTPHAAYHKAIDEDTGEIVGLSIWTVYETKQLDVPKELPPSTYWPNEEDAAYSNFILHWITQRRSKYIQSLNGNAVHLSTLAVLPEYQRKGVGSKLMAWGLQRADDLGFNVFVEASPMGRGLYEKSGFVFQGDITIDVPERFVGREVLRYASLIRPAKASQLLAIENRGEESTSV